MKQNNCVAIAVLATVLSDVMALAPAFVPRTTMLSQRSLGLSTLKAAYVGMPESGDPFSGMTLESSTSSLQKPQSSTIPDESSAASEKPAPGTAELPLKSKKVAQKPQQQHNEGMLSPVVLLAKQTLGDEELNKIRAKAISLHSDVIGNFVGTADTPLGAAVLKVLFKLVDRNHNGKIEEDELAKALQSLGFDWLKEKQVHGIFERADVDHNGAIDLEEWMKEAPKTLRTNLVKLAKKNGGGLGLLV